MSKVTKEAKNAIIAAFEIQTHKERAKELGGTVADYMLKQGKQANSVEQFDKKLQTAENWVLGEGAEVLKAAGLKVEMRKDGTGIKMPAAWKQAASDIRGTFKYGVDLEGVDTLSQARKLKTAAREAQQEAEHATEATENQTAAVQRLQRLLVMAREMSDGQAAALTHQLDELIERMQSGASQSEGSKQSKAA